MPQYGFGSGLIFGVRSEIANATPRLFCNLQEGSVGFSGDTKQLFGVAQFPVDVARAKMKIEGNAKLGQISGVIFNDLFFGEASGAILHQIAYLEAKTIPTAPFQVRVTNTTGFAHRTRRSGCGTPRYARPDRRRRRSPDPDQNRRTGYVSSCSSAC